MKKIIIVNLVIIAIIFCCAEIYSYNKLYNKYKPDIDAVNEMEANQSKGKTFIKPTMVYKKVVLPSKKRMLADMRPVEKRSEKLPPIILFGCSYTYGFGLNENETFSRKLADYTNRTVYNRGKAGTGIPFMYYQLKDEQISSSLPENPEYVIFTMIPDHLSRLFRYRNFVMYGDHTLRYKINSKGELQQDKLLFPFFHSLFSSILLEEYIAENNFQDRAKLEALFNKLMIESYKLIKAKYKNAKFVVIYIESPLDMDEKTIEMNDRFFKTINSEINNGIQVINITKVIPSLKTNEKYWLEDNEHPSALFWDRAIPVIVKRLKIKR